VRLSDSPRTFSAEALRTDNQGTLPSLSARALGVSVFTCDPGFDTIVAMDLVEWVEEAESLLRSDGLWPEQDEERARGLRERDLDVRDQSVTSRWLASGRC